MKVVVRKREKGLYCGENQGAFGRIFFGGRGGGKPNDFKSLGCRMSGFGVKGLFYTWWQVQARGQYRLFSLKKKSNGFNALHYPLEQVTSTIVCSWDFAARIEMVARLLIKQHFCHQAALATVILFGVTLWLYANMKWIIQSLCSLIYSAFGYPLVSPPTMLIDHLGSVGLYLYRHHDTSID